MTKSCGSEKSFITRGLPEVLRPSETTTSLGLLVIACQRTGLHFEFAYLPLNNGFVVRVEGLTLFNITTNREMIYPDVESAALAGLDLLKRALTESAPGGI